MSILAMILEDLNSQQSQFAEAVNKREKMSECRACGGQIFYSEMVHSWVHIRFLKTEEQHQAQPKG